MNDHRLNLSAGLASVTVALVLVGLKFWALLATGSLSVAASLADSGMDLVVSAVGLVAIFYANKPADDEHTFGHTSAEDLTSLFQAIVILISATLIANAALHRLLADELSPLEAQDEGILVMGVSIALTVGLVLWQRRVARRTGNKVVAADSLHYLGDLIPNIGAIIALFASSKLGLTRLDSIIALIAVVIMVRGAWHIGKGAWDALMDRSASAELLADIGRISDNYPGVLGWHDLRSRQSGCRVFINMHIELDGEQSLKDAHDIAAGLRAAILRAHPECDVILHQDPLGDIPR